MEMINRSDLSGKDLEYLDYIDDHIEKVKFEHREAILKRLIKGKE